ncbi:3-oxoacyl-ACP reductase [Kitasatospora sp. NE20-6]|uniref:SDR family NAD(P)-dependent oxidoreductase n=1 Tax=Kitasatospora sp. NE20-6 TaxID=2859066 RepID=UPI0034DBBFC6
MKHVVVTGASGDLGTAVVARAVASGAEVLAQFHTRPPAVPHPSVTPVRVDLTRDDGPAELVAALPWDRVDLLVNCIGGARPTRYADLSTAAWRECMQLNVEVPFAVTRELVGPLAAAAGAVVNLSSVAAFTGGAFGPHYAAGKAAVVGLTRSAARELGEQGIRVNCVAPGPVASAMTDALPDDVVAGLLAATALRRVVTPDEVADAVFGIAAATGVTGQTLVVDGGRFLH